LFFTPTPICRDHPKKEDNGRLNRYKAQLKQLIFNPGARVQGVPFIANKTAIFEPEVAALYDFKLRSTDYLGEACYLFIITPKPEHRSQVIYNNLTTWFRKSDYSILARDYALSYKTLLFDFDVKMKVRLKQEGKKMVPASIVYDGNWHLSTQGRERAKFYSYFIY